MTFTATYSPEDNKLRLYASSRLDSETYARVKAAGFSWAPRQELFVAPMWTPAREDLALELAGEIGDEDTSLAERAEARADRFDGYAGHRQADAESAERSAAAIADGIPLGQPILVGHHSERHARRDAEKIENGMRKAAKMWETSAYWLERAEGAIALAKYKELPRVRCNRIKTVEANKRRSERTIAEAEKFGALWKKTEEITFERATAIANHDHISIRDEGSTDWSNLWDLLDKGKIEPAAARERALKAHDRSIAAARRWIAHYDNRLAYERAMLAASGYKEPEKQKPMKSAKAALPLLNIRGEGSHEITKAEYMKRPSDYRGTRATTTYRYRVMLSGGHLVPVFLMDAKEHKLPEAKAAQA